MKSALPWQGSLVALAFAEALFFPLPPDLVLFPLCLAQPQRAFSWAALCLIASMCGGVLAYLLGYAFMSSVGVHLVSFLHAGDQVDKIGIWIGHHGFLALVFGVFSPVPYKLIALSSGIMSVPLGWFLTASIMGRGTRFFGVACVAKHPQLRASAQRVLACLSVKIWTSLTCGLVLLACVGLGVWL